MCLTSSRARTLLTLFALLLLLPVLGMRLQSVEELEAFHSRRLNPWPDHDGFSHDPTGFFAKARLWLADRVYPIRRASLTRKQIQFHVLRSSPQANLALGKNGFVFLTGLGEAKPYDVVEAVCVIGHTDGFAHALAHALTQLERFAEKRKLAVDVVLIPTLLSLYPDR